MAIIPYLLYEDVGGALQFLSRAFGFRQCGATLRGTDGRIFHAAMQLGRDLVMMGCPGKHYRNPKRVGHVTQNLYVNIRGVDKHFLRAKKAGATILEKPNDTEYGHRRYGVSDPEGHAWYFAQELRRSKPEKKSKKKVR